MRVVFDTNIFVSAVALPGSRAEQALLRVVAGKDLLIVSKPIIDELLTVLARKFSRDREELARLAYFISELGEVVHPELKIGDLEDEADNRVLECAIAGRADAIVTGDHAMLKLGKYEKVSITTLRDYLNST
ncbi:MAG: putative toxin-antitoxin system toxin component, PIN family [Gammaproteobacteria bacterium]